MASYEKVLSQNQLLKKNITNEKIAHQNTLNQLQNVHKMSQELQNHLKSSQQQNKELKLQIHTQTHRIQQLTYQYENQLHDLKELIDAKDLQMRRVYQASNLTDYDMIRIRVLNEVELIHHQQLQQKNTEINRIQLLLEDLTQRLSVSDAKNQSLQTNVQKMQMEHERNIEQLNLRHTKQFNQLYQKLQEERANKSHAIKQYELLKRKHQTAIAHYEGLVKELQGDQYKTRSLFSAEAPLGNSEQEIRKYRRKCQLAEEDLQHLRREMKTQKQTSKKAIDQLEKKNYQLSREIEQKSNELQTRQVHLKHELSLVEKENQRKNGNYQIKEKQLRQLQEENSRLKEEIKQIKHKDGKHAETLIKLAPHATDFDQLSRQKLKKENHQLRQQIQDLKRNMQKQKTRSKSPNQRSLSKNRKDYNLKAKLEQANSQIVTLLKQKITLKQQLSRYN